MRTLLWTGVSVPEKHSAQCSHWDVSCQGESEMSSLAVYSLLGVLVKVLRMDANNTELDLFTQEPSYLL